MNESLVVSLQDIVVDFDGERILDGLSLDIHDKEFVTFLGPSGCGKTTTLRVIAGFLSPRSGRVLFDGKDITNLPPYKRQVNTVFQSGWQSPAAWSTHRVCCCLTNRSARWT